MLNFISFNLFLIQYYSTQLSFILLIHSITPFLNMYHMVKSIYQNILSYFIGHNYFKQSHRNPFILNENIYNIILKLFNEV
jgi:hypothetical protein